MTNESENMTPAEAAEAAREAFLSAEQAGYRATSAAAPHSEALWELANAVTSIAYGLKLMVPMPEDARD